MIFNGNNYHSEQHKIYVILIVLQDVDCGRIRGGMGGDIAKVP